MELWPLVKKNDSDQPANTAQADPGGYLLGAFNPLLVEHG